MRVLMLVIRYDRSDWATNFIPHWVTGLAAHVSALDVLALEVGDVGILPTNVRLFSMGKERGAGRAGLLRNFYRHAVTLIPRCDAVFVHMIPRYALLAAPLALPLGKPITLWYTHRHASADLKRALPLVRRVLTAVPNSFPLQTPKLQVLGHGVDVNFFSPLDVPAPAAPPHIVQVARLQAIKRQDQLIQALAHLPDAHAQIVGAVPADEPRTYADSLPALASTLGVAPRVTFTGGLGAAAVRDLYRAASVAVNLSPTGLFDKAALESMATATPTLVINPAFDALLGEWQPLLRLTEPFTPATLATHLQEILALPAAERARMGATLRANVRAAHSLEALLPRLAAALAVR